MLLKSFAKLALLLIRHEKHLFTLNHKRRFVTSGVAQLEPYTWCNVVCITVNISTQVSCQKFICVLFIGTQLTERKNLIAGIVEKCGHGYSQVHSVDEGSCTEHR